MVVEHQDTRQLFEISEYFNKNKNVPFLICLKIVHDYSSISEGVGFCPDKTYDLIVETIWSPRQLAAVVRGIVFLYTPHA